MNDEIVQTTPRAGAADDALSTLVNHLFRPTGVDGIYGRTSLYETVVERLGALISRHREPNTEIVRFPPVMSRDVLERSGYLKSFPNLLGCVCVLHGSEDEIRRAADRHEAGGDWTSSLTPADLVLTPAACYPVYPLAARDGTVPSQGRRFDVACDCFRREPSKRLDRLQSFRMREYVCIGTPEQVLEFREQWKERGRHIAEALGLNATIAPANDPFFGRVGRVMGISQLQQALKFELLIPVYPASDPTACMSFNYHRDHFGLVWNLYGVDGSVAHTGCAAFGLDRLAMALFVRHGTRLASWPEPVRCALEIPPADATES